MSNSLLTQMGTAMPAIFLKLKLGIACNHEIADRWGVRHVMMSTCAIGCGPGSPVESRRRSSTSQKKIKQRVLDHGRRGRLGGRVCCNAGSGASEDSGREGEVGGIVDGMRKILGGEEKELATKAALDLVSSLDQKGRMVLLSAFYRCGDDDHPDSHFNEADVNLDGMLDRKEFATYAEAQAIRYGNALKPLTSKQMVHLFTRAALGMVGFGFTDNAIMIIAGDAIQNSIGATLGLTTLLSAGLGNAVADLVGTAFRGYIERWSGKLMPEVMPISAHQMEQKEAWWAETVGASTGVTIGCLLGLAPIFILHSGEQGSNSNSNGVNETKFASISRSSASFSRTYATVAAQEFHENQSQTSSLTTSIQTPTTPQLRSFASQVWGAPVLVSMIVLIAFRRVANHRKIGGILPFGSKKLN